MNQDEIKAALKDVVTNLVKDDNEAAQAAFHQVLQAKMRDRINPPEAVTPETTPADSETDITSTPADTPAE
jgi:hypothetical protein